jgi:hypothetical protein
LLDLLFWAIVLLAPVYAVLVMVGYQRPGGVDALLVASLLRVLLWLPVLLVYVPAEEPAEGPVSEAV